MSPAEGGPPRLQVAADGCATVTLQRPRHRNRLHREDLLALQAPGGGPGGRRAAGAAQHEAVAGRNPRGGFDGAAVDERVQHCAQSADLREGLTAFAAKRPPRFTGR